MKLIFSVGSSPPFFFYFNIVVKIMVEVFKREIKKNKTCTLEGT